MEHRDFNSVLPETYISMLVSTTENMNLGIGIIAVKRHLKTIKWKNNGKFLGDQSRSQSQ